jgi:hypothetical protein
MLPPNMPQASLAGNNCGCCCPQAGSTTCPSLHKPCVQSVTEQHSSKRASLNHSKTASKRKKRGRVGAERGRQLPAPRPTTPTCPLSQVHHAVLRTRVEVHVTAQLVQLLARGRARVRVEATQPALLHQLQAARRAEPENAALLAPGSRGGSATESCALAAGGVC